VHHYRYLLVIEREEEARFHFQRAFGMIKYVLMQLLPTRSVISFLVQGIQLVSRTILDMAKG
jgi:hypothetical protein